jgi:mannosyltransferase
MDRNRMDYDRESLYIKSANSKLMLLVILFLGLFLRIYHLGDESIWLDEAVSIKWANLSPFQILVATSKDVHTPLYYIILHFWISLFGDSEFSTRFLSLIFGLLSIFMIYRVGSLISDRETGLLSSLILALSAFHIYYSQEIKMYSLLSLLTLLSMYFFIKILKEKNLIVSIGYVVFSTFLVYVHSFGIFIIIAQNAFIFTLFLSSKREGFELNLRRWVLLQVVLIALFTPWIMILIKQILRAQSGSKIGWIPEPSIHSIIKSFKLYSGSNLFLCLFLILSFFSLATHEKLLGRTNWKKSLNSTPDDKGYVLLSNFYRNCLLLVWLLTPIVLPFVISKVSAPIYWYRYTIVASLAFYLLVAKGIRSISSGYLKFAVISLVILGSLVGVQGYNLATNKERWRELVTYVETNAEHGDLLLFNAGYSQVPFDYYSRRTDLIKRPFPEDTITVDKENIKELANTIEGHNRVWVIQSHSGDSEGLINKTLGKSYNLSYYQEYVSIPYASDKKYTSIEVYLFQKK